LLEMVFRVKQLFNMNSLLVSISVGLLLVLIFLLSLRLRTRERKTMFQLGCSRSTIWKLQLTEMLFILGTGLVFVLVIAFVFRVYAYQIMRLLFIE